MSTNPSRPAGADLDPAAARPQPLPGRVFLREPGWRIGQKVGSVREFCYMMAPGQDFYHRLLDGELYVYHGDERLCLACATRRGLLSYEPRPLREPGIDQDLDDLNPDTAEYDLGPGPFDRLF